MSYLTYLRRRWCAWRAHPDSGTGPVVYSQQEPDGTEGGIAYPGRLWEVRAYRCGIHD